MFGDWSPDFLVFARRCWRLGVPVHWMDIAAQPPDSRGYSRCLAGAGFLSRKQVGTAEGILAIKRFVESVGGGALLGHGDRHLLWLAANRDQLAPVCRLLSPSLPALQLATSKRLQFNLATRIGMKVLPTWWLEKDADMEQIPEIAFPLVIRPDRESDIKPYRKTILVQSRADLRAFLQGTVLQAAVIAQPFLNLPNLLVHGVRSEQGELLAMETFLVPRKFQSVSLTVQNMSLTSNKLKTLCAQFVDAADITGPFHFEFLYSRDNEEATFLEINARLGGTTDKVFRLGFDEPGLTLVAYGLVAPSPTTHLRRTPRVAVNKRMLIKHAGRALRGKLSALDHPPVSRWMHVWLSARDFVCGKDSVFDFRDLPGSFRFYLHGTRR